MKQLEFYKNNPKDFRVKKHSEKDLYIIKYKKPSVDWSNEWTRQARGIVLDGESNVVSRPFEKFFNYRELRHREDLDRKTKRLSEWNSDSFTVFEKLDGSLCVVSEYEGEFIVSSSGNLEGEFPDKFRRWFKKNFNSYQKKYLKSLTRNYTLIFEYISPNNRVVVNYKKEDMVLIGMIHTESGKEITDFKTVDMICEELDISRAHVYNLSYDGIMRLVELDYDEDLIEGFVVRLDSGKRLKIKTEDYVELHNDHTFGFGRPDTKHKIRTYIDRIENDTVDDLIAAVEARKDKQVIDVINEVMRLYDEFNDIVEQADRIVGEERFSKKDYAIKNGNGSWQSLLVLNNNKRDKFPVYRERFILEHLEGDN